MPVRKQAVLDIWNAKTEVTISQHKQEKSMPSHSVNQPQRQTIHDVLPTRARMMHPLKEDDDEDSSNDSHAVDFATLDPHFSTGSRVNKNKNKRTPPWSTDARHETTLSA